MKAVNKLSVLIGIGLSLFLAGCKKVEVGYLSDNIRYGSNPVIAERGVFKIATGIIPDNSTPPFKISIVNVRNKATGKREEAFFKTEEITVWKEKYNPLTDTTLALINAKQTKEKVIPLQVIEKSGQLLFTQATTYVPAGEYLLDLEIQNPNGSKTYEGITTIQLKDPELYATESAPYFIAVDPSTGAGVRYPHDAEWFDITKFKSGNAQFKITHDPKGPNQIILKIYDKNGKLFPGRALEKRPNGDSFLNNLSNFAYKTTNTEDAVIYDYAQARFPDVYWDSQPNGVYNYYRIYDKWIESIDYVDTWDPPKTLTYKTDPKPYILQIRFDLTFFLPGTYVCELHLAATKKAGVK